MPKTTLADVAAACGVSVRTVSNVVNNAAVVAPATRERVMAACKALDYRPNLGARALRTGKTGLVGLIVPELRQPYFAQLADAVIAAAARQGTAVLVEASGGTLEGERAALERTRRHGLFDGMLMSPVALPAAEIQETAGRCVLLGPRPVPANTAHVGIDNAAAARAATDHLLDLGHRRIAALGRMAQVSAASEGRLAGYRAAFAARGLTPPEGLEVPVKGFTREAGAEATAALLAQASRPEALFCFSDLLAIGAMQAARAAGLRVPQDLAICGFDGIDEGRFAAPGLTTIRSDLDQIADLALGLLSDDTPQHRVVPFDLHIGGSTTP